MKYHVTASLTSTGVIVQNISGPSRNQQLSRVPNPMLSILKMINPFWGRGVRVGTGSLILMQVE